MVGCVIARGERVLAEGWHRKFGRAHAEVDALKRCNEDPRGATVYVTLQPCCFYGKTPPCTQALIAAGVGRVVYAMTDPNPAVDGRGGKQLRAAGIRVDGGLCESEAASLNAPFLTLHREKRPWVIAKWAQSLDGKLATRRGDSQWISGEESRRWVHRLRARVCAIMVGAQTACKDDPLLTARDVPLRRRAVRVVLDGRLRIPLKCQLVGTAQEIPTIVYTSTAAARSAKAGRLQRAGVTVIRTRSSRGRIALKSVLHDLGRRGLTNLLVEGGATLLTSFFEADLVDEAHAFVAPLLIGGATAPSAWLGKGSATVSTGRETIFRNLRSSGPDAHFHLRFRYWGFP